MRHNKLVFSRVFIYVYLLFILLMTAFGIVVYQLTAITVERQLGKKCAGIAIAVATMLETNADDYRKFAETLDTSSDYYQKTKQQLEEIRAGNEGNIIFLYTEKIVAPIKMMYIIDGEHENAPNFSPPGEMNDLTPTRDKAYKTGKVTIGTFVTTPYGTLLSAYAPIKDKDGTVLGLVGVDVSNFQYREILKYFITILVASIGFMVLTFALALLLSSKRITKLVSIDSLTGAYNKNYFLRSLKSQAATARRKDQPLLVIMADLDHFKNVNDTYGHPFGDKTLIAVANAIKSVLRESDCLARYGGEEFSAYFPGITNKNAQILMERIRVVVQSTRVHNAEHNTDVTVTISIGAAFLGIHQTVNEVLEDADKALYHAKKTRNTITFHADTLPPDNSSPG